MVAKSKKEKPMKNLAKEAVSETARGALEGLKFVGSAVREGFAYLNEQDKPQATPVKKK